MRRVLLSFLFVFLGSAIARAEAPKAVAPAEVGLDAAKLAEIPRAFAEFVEKKRISGSVTLVARQGRIAALDAVGLADIDAKTPMKADTLFWIASMTKPIASTAFMILVDEGKVSIDDPVEKYVPEFARTAHKDGAAPRKTITLRHLLTHTSGLSNPVFDPAASAAPPTLAEVAVNIARQPLRFEPDEKWEYGGGSNITVIGRVVEIVSGKPFAAFLQERIFDPLGMTDTGFYPDAARRARLAKIYKPGKEKGTLEATGATFINSDEKDKKRFPNPSGGLFSSARDLMVFHQMVLNGGEYGGKRILSKKAVDVMTSVHTRHITVGLGAGRGWGLGWSVSTNSPNSFGHGGAFGTQAHADPAHDLVMIMLVHRSGFPGNDGPNMQGVFQRIAVSAAAKPAAGKP
jgi:CubicO group peptidase (beta-lactamase class C family)